MRSGGTVLGILGIIIGAVGVGFAFIVWNNQQEISSDLDDLTSYIVVGIWDDLETNKDIAPYQSDVSWLVALQDNYLNNSEYISVSNNNTRITLLKAGMYKIHISTALEGILANEGYQIILMKNGIDDFFIEDEYTKSDFTGQYLLVESSGFVYSNGVNYIEIHGYGSFDFFITNNSAYNQFSIDYVVE